jgi:hypothetical protein
MGGWNTLRMQRVQSTKTSDYLQEWSRKLKSFNRMTKIRRLFAKK